MLKSVLRATYCCSVHSKSSTYKISRFSHFKCVLKLNKPNFKYQISSLTSSASLQAKTYIESENMFAHDVMEKNEVYRASLAPPPKIDISSANEEEFSSILAKDWSKEQSSTLCKDFKTISDSASTYKREITEVAFDGLCEAVVAKQSEFTDEELASILRSLSHWPQAYGLNSRNFSNVWSAMDRQCVARVRSWDNTTLLFFADHWYQLHLLRVTKFMWHCVRKLTQKPKKLTPSNLVQCMFYVNACRKMNPAISLFELEFQIERCMDKLTSGELAIVAMGFFKTQTRIRNPNICVRMMQIVTAEADTIPDITLAALVKAIRFAVPLSHSDMLTNMLDKLLPNVKRLSPLCCVHLALTGTNSQMFHKGMLKAVSQKLVTNITELRIKDIERLAFALTMFNFDPKTTPCIFLSIVDELKKPSREDEIRKYPRCLAATLQFLALKNVYVDDLSSKVLDAEFISATYGAHCAKVARDALLLDIAVEVDRPGYRGHRLAEKTRHALAKNFSAWSLPMPSTRNLSATEQLTVDVMESLEVLLRGRDFVFIGSVLPNSPRPDMVVGIGSDGLAVPIPSDFTDSVAGAVIRAPAESAGVRWNCITVAGWNSYIRDTEAPVGVLASRLRQIKKLGYHVIVVPWFEWIKVPEAERQNYLHRKLMLPG